MHLYLVRHARAADVEPGRTDRDRRLSPEGREDAARLARALDAAGVRFDLIATSPLARAVETAEVLRAAGLAPRVLEVAELAPGGELAAWLPTLAAHRDAGGGDLAAVGHLPGLVAWAEQLAFGAAPGRLVLKPGGVVALELPQSGAVLGSCSLFWLASPRHLA